MRTQRKNKWKQRVSHGETLLQIKWLIPMTMPCIWICMRRFTVHSHLHTRDAHTHGTQRITINSIQFFSTWLLGTTLQRARRRWETHHARPGRDLAMDFIYNNNITFMWVGINRTWQVFGLGFRLVSFRFISFHLVLFCLHWLHMCTVSKNERPKHTKQKMM